MQGLQARTESLAMHVIHTGSRPTTTPEELPLYSYTIIHTPAIRISAMSFSKLAAIAALATVASGKPELVY